MRILVIDDNPDDRELVLREVESLFPEADVVQPTDIAEFEAALEASEEVERLGYKVELTGKHGQFEISGISRADILAFSTRRTEILESFSKLDIQNTTTRNEATLRTRATKRLIPARKSIG